MGDTRKLKSNDPAPADKKQASDRLNRKQTEITNIIKIYNDINSKIDKVVPLLLEILVLAIDFDNKTKFNSYFKIRFRMGWIVRTVLVAVNQLKKNLEYMEMVNKRRQDITDEYTEQESAFE